MDKILYMCNPAHLGYEFPKRKWWDFRKKERRTDIMLTGLFPDENMDILVQVLENYPTDYEIFIEEHWKKEIWRTFLRAVWRKNDFEAMLAVDITGEDFSDILADYVEDKNYLAVLTTQPKRYDGVMDEIAMEYGLVGMVCANYGDFVRYRKQIGEQKRTVILWGNGEMKKVQNGRPMLCRFGKEDFVIDFTLEQEYKNMFSGKRMEPDYASLSVFLDNIVKNGYNSVVNEGLQRL